MVDRFLFEADVQAEQTWQLLRWLHGRGVAEFTLTHVDPIKVRDYLLSMEHPVGRGKARFFLALGFNRNEWSILQQALLSVATEAKATALPASPYGQKYEAHATLQGPRGQAAEVVTIWIILTGEAFPRLVTAYPGDVR